jgi:hypothetical protein
MGSTQALGMAEAVEDGLVGLETALDYHLRHNHYPPVPSSMIPVCIDAIDAINEDDHNRQVTLPDGVTYRDQPTAPAHAIAEAHHLQAFLILTEAS